MKGQVNTGYPVGIYDIDLVDATAPVIDSIQASGAKVTCYFSAGSYEKWRPDAAEFA
ncbi:MAG: endo alpha-1,4 polygalactosaminidase, partial [Thermoleophilia bacterium]